MAERGTRFSLAWRLLAFERRRLAAAVAGVTFAVVLILGAFTRVAAIVWIVMMAAFMVGVIWVWAKGYSIDCGCFGGGGDVGEGETNYPVHLAERIGFTILGTWLLVFPRSEFSLDGWMARSA